MKKNIPLVNLKKEFLLIESEINKKMNDIFLSSSFILGEELLKFEGAFSKYIGTSYCLGVGSGTSALHLSLLSIDIGKGDEVITTALSFNATTEAILHAGAKPIFCDVNLSDGNINVDQIETLITDKTKALLVVHLYGIPNDIAKIKHIANKYNLYLIEDCAQAHGAEYDGQKVGSFGDVGCFSFMPAKNLGSYGDGGCIVTDNKKIFETIKKLRNHGRTDKYTHSILGYSSRLDNLQAGILNIKLHYLDTNNKIRRDIAKKYDLFFRDKFGYLSFGAKKKPSYYSYILFDENRYGLKEFLLNAGIQTNIYYPKIIPLQPMLSHLGYKKGDFPNAETIAKTNLAIPMNPYLTDDEIEYIKKHIDKYFSRNKENFLCNKNNIKKFLYKDKTKLETRLNVWNTFGSNKISFFDWILDNLQKYCNFTDAKVSLLDLGCGNGDFLEKIQKQYNYLSLSGIDISEKMIYTAKNKLGKYVNLFVGDVEKLTKDNLSGNNIITAIHLLHHIKDRDSFLEHLSSYISRSTIFAFTITDLNLKNGLNKIHYESLKENNAPDRLVDVSIYKKRSISNLKKTILKYFDIVDECNFLNNLVISDSDIIMKYYKSAMLYRNMNEDDKNDFKLIDSICCSVKKRLDDIICKKGSFEHEGNVKLFILKKTIG